MAASIIYLFMYFLFILFYIFIDTHYIMIRYPCVDCGERFTTGRGRSGHQCGRPKPPPRKRVRTNDPSGLEETGALNELFKIINIPISATTPAITEELEGEMERLGDILR